MKITAPTKERHDIWLNVCLSVCGLRFMLTCPVQALKYLLARPNTMNSPRGNALSAAPMSPTSGPSELPYDDGRPGLMSSPRSFRSGRSTQANADWTNSTRGQRSRSQISFGGSIGKRSGTPAAEYLRYGGSEDPLTPTKSIDQGPGAGIEDGDDLEFELHNDSFSDGFDGLENVRACCDGMHTVGGHHHHHHHHHPPQQPKQPQPQPAQNGQSQRNDHHLDTRPTDPRPTSPAFSFRSRSRAGSATSHDGGGFFSSRMRFGSKRSTKTAASAQETT
jgi:hypothetical protein